MYRSSTDAQYLADGTVTVDADGIPVKVAGPGLVLDTGWRQITHPSVTSGFVRIRRIGAVVYLHLEGVTFGTLSGTQIITGFLPSGFRGSGGFLSFTTVPVYGPARGFRVRGGGDLEVFGLASGDSLRADVSFPTEGAAPTEPYPGTPY